MSKQEELNKIVNVHLGKAGDGTAVKPYVTPDAIDKTLLVPVPRYLNRTDYGIEEEYLPFVGFDTWNCYEVSALMDNGYPVSGTVKLVYSSSNFAIVESKSLKLYLNSYNMAKMGKTFDEAAENIEKQITEDLSEALKTQVKVKFFGYNTVTVGGSVDMDAFLTLENLVDLEEITFDQYNEDPNTLVFEEDATGYKSAYGFRTNALRSNCRVTNQPDWGDLFIYFKSSISVTPESLLQYVVSMRKENHFHEEIVECVYKRLYDALPEGSEIGVIALYTRRGGIDINPARFSHEHLIEQLATPLADENYEHVKTARQ